MAEQNTPNGIDVPTPHQVPHTQAGVSAPAVPSAEPHPERWGRIDDEGTVYVRTADGERVVGVWQAGSPDEGLTHFARRFDDLRTEVELLETRLSSGAGDPKQALTSASGMRDGLSEAAVVGDIEALRARIEQVIGHAERAMAEVKQEREQARAAAVTRKQQLAEEAETIANESTQWKVAGDRLRAILDEWKTVKGVDRKTDDELWKRFSKAREAFNRRRGSHFADLDKQRAVAKRRKEELIAEAESMADSTDWGPTAGRYKDLMAEWKAAGRAPKDTDEALWQRFRAAQDDFFARRSAAFSERDAEFAENAARKEELLAEAEKIDAAANLDAAKSQLRKVQEQWDEIGKVPRERIRELDGRLKAVQDRVRSAEDSKWRRTDPEAQARAAQFRERVEQFEAQASKARAAGDERRAKKAEEQAAQWREWLLAAEAAVADR
ncbi:DNA repair ATPase [Prauserella marina]|uniref:Uncharacterized protein n=1 Tax=Prauserella marina TaxID=530584 RepID=A0A222VUC4_9PSEU|nr:DUF349 domain-containing protein [Prauserella marina]ASR37490.1 DNA repair ATPase [Prauserella marina]PWV74614.1 uncharacterized protein DUF349 [Prauserella marina]SDD45274.1 protein of unknown function [Prauserella marina]